MSDKIGIDDLKKLFLATIEMGNACGIAFEDGHIGIGDIQALVAFGTASKDMALVDFKMVMPEFKDIDDGEMAELMQIVEEHFDIPEEKVEDKVKQILGLAARLYSLVSDAIDMFEHPETMG